MSEHSCLLLAAADGFAGALRLRSPCNCPPLPTPLVFSLPSPPLLTAAPRLPIPQTQPLPLPCCACLAGPATRGDSVMDLLKGRPDMSILVRVVQAAGLEPILAGVRTGRLEWPECRQAGRHAPVLLRLCAVTCCLCHAVAAVAACPSIHIRMQSRSPQTCGQLPSMAPNPPPAAADPDFGGTLLAPSNCYWKHLLADLDITEAMMLQQSNALNTVLLVRCAALWAAVLRCTGSVALAPTLSAAPQRDLAG